MLEQVLIGIGFSHKEASVYLAALELGPQPVSVIAKQANINRSTAYIIIKSLMSKGVMSTFNKKGIKYFAALEPETLLRYIKRHSEELVKSKRIIEENLKDFQSLANPYSERPKVQFFEGFEGIKEVYEDSLKVGDPIVGYESIDAMPQEIREYIFDNYIPRRIEQKIPIKIIGLKTKAGESFKSADKSSHRQTKLVDKKGLNIEINIYGNKSAFMAYHEAKYTGIIIDNKPIADALRFGFELAWEGIKKPKKKRAGRQDA